MGEFLEKIFTLLTTYFNTKQKYEWRFYNLTGKEENNQLKIQNSIEYEFINSGNSYVILNDVLILYPKFMGIEPTRVKFSTNKNEVDVNVYEYQFRDILAGDAVQGLNVAANPNYNILTSITPSREPFNKLQVIVKQVSRN